MRILIAGATGVIGQELLPLLAGQDHLVFGVSRSHEKSAELRRLGAEPVIADGLDPSSLHAAVLRARPQVIVHQMASLSNADYRQFDRSFAVTNRLRTEGTDALLAAAREVGAARFIAQSYCGWPYARTGAMVKSEEDALDADPPREAAATLAAIKHLERAVTQSNGPAGLVLRYGTFYGPSTGMLDPARLADIRRRRFPLVGAGNGWWSFVEVSDAARATVLAITHGVPGSIYNIVDDEPAPVREWLPELARILGAKPPLKLPAWLARLIAGEHLVIQMTESRAGSNAKAKRELHWQPRFPSWRDGFAAALRKN
jgi:2-alkyl-3-oxoalkanoate reductase